jgi:hypothetical protein
MAASPTLTPPSALVAAKPADNESSKVSVECAAVERE